MRSERLLFIVLAAGLALGGCASHTAPTDFSKRVDQIRNGMTEAQVRNMLGAPDRKVEGVISVGSEPSPPAPVAAVLLPGQHYKHWFYKQGSTYYHVYFGPSDTHPGRWEVVGTRANPASAGYIAPEELPAR